MSIFTQMQSESRAAQGYTRVPIKPLDQAFGERVASDGEPAPGSATDALASAAASPPPASGEGEEDPAPLTDRRSRDGPRRQGVNAASARPSVPPQAVSTPPPPSANTKGAASQLARVAYYSHWINLFDRVKAMTDAGAAAQEVSRALTNPPRLMAPEAGDARLFRVAGSAQAPYGELASWLRFRRAIGADDSRVSASMAAFWEKRLAGVSEPPSPTVLARTVGEAEAEGQGLTPAQLHGLRQHPAWALAYLRIGALKATLDSAPPAASARPAPTLAVTPSRQTGAPSSTLPVHGGSQSSTSGPPSTLTVHPLRPDGAPAPAIVQTAYGGDDLAQRLGSLLAAPIGIASALAGQVGKGVRLAARESLAAFRERRAAELIGEADMALVKFRDVTDALRQHPQLTDPWRRAETTVEAVHQGDWEALERAMARADHPLQREIRTILAAHPDLERLAAQAHAAFDRVLDTWGQCARAHARLGREWHPHDAQLNALQAASLQVLPDGRRTAALIQTVQRLIAAFANHGPRPTASAQASPHPTPGR